MEILDAGNLSEAARRLKVSRANVSYHLNQLERAVGAQLMRRNTRRVEPTEIGLRLYEHGRRIQNELLAAKESVTTLGSSLQGRVRLSVPSGYGQIVMSGWLIEFKRMYPGIVLEVLFENRVDDLLREEVDFAIRIIREPPSTLVARELGSVRYVACASKGYAAQHALPAQLEDLRTAPVITSSGIGRQLRLSAYRGEQREEVILTPTVISENYAFLRQAVLGGLGIGLLPDYLVQQDVADGEVLTTLDAWTLSIFATRMFMLYMPNRHHTRAAQTFIDFILEQAHASGRREVAPLKRA